MDEQEIRILVETPLHRIVGTLSLPDAGWRSRVTDYFNAADRDFFALTDAEISRVGGSGPTERHSYVAVSRAHIILALEATS
jgi:hypothetical protein